MYSCIFKAFQVRYNDSMNIRFSGEDTECTDYLIAWSEKMLEPVWDVSRNPREQAIEILKDNRTSFRI